VKFLAFLKTTAKKLGDQYIVGPPTYKLGDQSSPFPYSCWAYDISSRCTCRPTINVNSLCWGIQRLSYYIWYGHTDRCQYQVQNITTPFHGC